MIAKNLDGLVPAPGALSDADRALLDAAYALPASARAAMEDFALHGILADIWRVVGDANRYFAAEEPWVKRKTDPDRFGTILYVTAETLRVIGIMAQPAIPKAAGQLLDLLAVPPDRRSFADVGQGGRIAPGTRLPPPAPIFPRYVEAEETKAGA